MLRLGWITATRRPEDRMVALLQFFGVGSVAAWRAQYEQPLAALRAAPSHPCKPGALAAWLRRAEVEASALPTAAYQADAFRATLPTLRALTRNPDPHTFIPALTEACAAHGVAVVLIPAPRGCPVSGATRWLTPKKAMLALSLRHGTSDSLWFSFFHEAAHLVLHGKRLHFFELEGALTNAHGAEADAFARDLLIPPAHAAALATVADDADQIVALADRLGVAPAIVLGRLQHERRIAWNRHAHLRPRYRWR